MTDQLKDGGRIADGESWADSGQPDSRRARYVVSVLYWWCTGGGVQAFLPCPVYTSSLPCPGVPCLYYPASMASTVCTGWVCTQSRLSWVPF